ncbi:MAG: NYN domain-containing protein [Dehalococcoidia bacterium]
MTMPLQATASTGKTRIRVFIDFWNFQLTLNGREAKARGEADARFPIDWRALPNVITANAALVLGVTDYAYEGTIIYASYNPGAADGPKQHRWLTTWLDRQPGLQVVCLERQPKAPPTCPSCHQAIVNCPHCNARIKATIEKGVDTALVTDMIRLAWEDAHDVGVLVSSDRDLVPAVKFLDAKGRKTIQAGFPPTGVDLATSCWASFDLFPLREQFRRK